MKVAYTHLAQINADMQPMKPQEVADILGKKNETIRQMMVRMARDGDIQKIAYGIYASKNYVEQDGNDENNDDAGHTRHTVTAGKEAEEKSEFRSFSN